MLRYAVLLVGVALLFTPREDVHAIPVTLRIDSLMTLGCGACSGFTDETGLVKGPGVEYDVFALLTFDTSVTPQTINASSAFYLLDQPGAQLSVFVGSWSAHYSAVGLNLSEDFGVGGVCDQLSVYRYPGSVERGSLFNTSNCVHPETKLPDYSLDSLVGSLSGFTGTTFDTVINQKITSGSTWWLQGHVRSVTRVPEPTTLSLLFTGLFVLSVLRRRSKS